MPRPTLTTPVLALGLALCTSTTYGAEIGHYAPGLPNIRDLAMPAPGFFVDIAFGYGFYAPVGTYDTDTVLLPRGNTVTAEASDNIGLGFWTHQLQGAVTWYPWANKATTVVAALTYELHGDKQDFALTPGQNLTLNWGISQFLPLQKDQQLLLEAGLTGHSSWQISDDSGSDARNPSVRDQVHAVGGQLGLTYLPWVASLNVHYFGEFAALDRFQGQVIGVSVAKKF